MTEVHDARLRRAAALLDQGEVDVLSLDIFDTLLWRTVPEPVDAFPLLGRRLQETGRLSPRVSGPVFGRLRQEAEARARRRVAPGATAPEVSLVDIYEEFPGELVCGADPVELARLEVEFERTITFPDLDVVGLAQWAHDGGTPIVLVSDTYYGEGQLRQMLDREPFLSLDVKRIFTSSEHKVGKGSGLFGVVLEALGVPPARVLHVGDHPDADARAAEKEGMRAVHFDKVPKPLAEVLQREGLLGPRSSHRRRASVDLSEGDLGMTALRAKVASRAELADLPEAVADYWRFGAVVLGPVFTAFAEWIHERAQDEGASTAYCMMREGEFLSRLVNGARGYLRSGVSARTVWVSRHVCSRAAIFRGDEKEIAAFLGRRRAPTVREVCDSLGVTLGQLPELHSEADSRLDDADLRRRLIAALTGRPDVRATIVRGAAELRERMIAHVAKTVDAAEGDVLVADLGWGGTIQAYLQKILEGSGLSVRTRGLYLLTNQAAVERMLDGVDAEGFLGSAGFPETPAAWIGRSPEILEQVCMTDVGSLAGFTDEGEPVTAPAGQRPVQMLQRAAVQNGILAFQREWARYADVVPAGQRSLSGAARPLLLNALARFVVTPTAAEAAMFGTWLHDENYGSEDSETVFMSDLANSLRYMTPEQFLALPMTRVYWPFGLAALNNPGLAVAAAAMDEGVVPVEAWRPSEEAEVVVAVDSGGGFDAGLTSRHRVARSGLAFVRAEMRTPGILAVRVQAAEGPALVRIDSLFLSFTLRGRPDPVRLRFEWPEELRRLDHENCVTLADNLLLAAQSPPLVMFACPPEWGLDACALELEMAFAALPLAPARDPDRRPPSKAEVARQLARRVRRKALTVWRSSAAQTTQDFRAGTG